MDKGFSGAFENPIQRQTWPQRTSTPSFSRLLQAQGNSGSDFVFELPFLCRVHSRRRYCRRVLFCVEFIRDVDIAVVNFWIFAVVIVLRFYFVVQHNNPLSNFDLNGWLRALG